MSENGPDDGDGAPDRGMPEWMKAFALPAILGLVAAGIGIAGIHGNLAEREEERRLAAVAARPALTMCKVPDRASLVPERGALFGVNLDLGTKSLSRYAADLGHEPAVSVTFTGFPYTAAEKADLQRAVTQMRGSGQMLLLTLEPVNGLGGVTEESALALAKDLSTFNDEGVPVIVRFAHEMNGSWYPWSHQPARYINAFQTIAAAIHGNAPGSAMMWAPNYGGGYPFKGGEFEAKPGTEEFIALDTDSDGVLTMRDDPYAPFYPGDEAVDWVGMSLYHWGAEYPWGENELSEADKFADQLTGNYVGVNGDDSLIPDFYQVYGQEHGKPVAIPETAALFVPDAGGAQELDIKRSWWGQLLTEETASRFPQLKMINWFEWDKNEVEVNGRVDWTLTNQQEIREAFRASLPDWLHYAEPRECE